MTAPRSTPRPGSAQAGLPRTAAAADLFRLRTWPLSTKLWLLVLGGILLAALAVLGVSTRKLGAALRAEARSEFMMASTGNLNSAAEALNRAFAVLRGVAVDPVVVDLCAASGQEGLEIVGGDVSELQLAWTEASDDSALVQAVVDPQLNLAAAQLRNHLVGLPSFVEVLVTDRSGGVVAATGRPESVYQVPKAWWAPSYDGGQGSQYVGIHRRAGDPDTYRDLEIAVPIYEDPVNQTKLVGLVYARIGTDYLIAALGDVRPLDGTDVLIVNQHGQTVAATQADLVGTFVEAKWLQSDVSSVQEGRVTETESLAGAPVLLARASMSDLPIGRSDDAEALEELGWTLFVYGPLRRAYAAADQAILGAWLWAGGVVFILLALGLLLSQALVFPLSRFLDTLRGPAGGDLAAWDAARAYQSTSAGQEVDLLARSFGHLLDERETLHTALMKQEAALTEARTFRRTEVSLLSSLGDLMAVSTEVTELVQRAVDIIKAQKNLYYVSLYGVDSSRRGGSGRRGAVLQAGTGESGRSLLARGHRVEEGAGLVGLCLSSGMRQVRQDLDGTVAPVDQDEAHAVDAGLSDDRSLRSGIDHRYARSEIAVPLRSRGTVSGVLLAQSYEADTFSGAFADIYQIIADQLAVTIDSVRLASERREAADRLQRAYGELTREAWLELLGGDVARGYEATGTGARPLPALDPAAWQDLRQDARLTETSMVVHDKDNADVMVHRVSIPIRARDEVIGILDASRLVNDGELTPDEIAALTELSAQLGLALENARLYELARRRAVEEQIVGQATRRMRETLSVDAVLQTAARELRDLLNLEGVEIRVGSDIVDADSDGYLRPNGGNGDGHHREADGA